MTTTCKVCEKSLAYYDRVLQTEWHDAVVEYNRLKMLFKDVVWYDFEVQVRDWKQPWHSSLLESPLALQGMRFRQYYNKGVRREHGTFPDYYRGTLREAPRCPIRVLHSELRDARRHMLECYDRVNDAHDWAPGGPKYKRLCTETRVGKIFQ